VNAKLKEPKFAIGAAVAAGLLVVVAGWVLLVSPAKSKASKLQTQVESTQAEIATRRAAIASKPKIRVDVRSSDLFRLTKAVPGRQDMSGIVLELNRVAKSTGVSFDSITPSQPVQAQGYNVHPLAVVVSGKFGEVNGFLHSVRKLVTVRKGKLDARGRLFAIDTVSVIEEPDKHFPTVQATVTLDAFVYAGGSGPGTTGTPGTTTPSTGTSSPSGAVAAGATS
jgi:Tfp pilus assembly protein PilO